MGRLADPLKIIEEEKRILEGGSPGIACIDGGAFRPETMPELAARYAVSFPVFEPASG